MNNNKPAIDTEEFKELISKSKKDNLQKDKKKQSQFFNIWEVNNKVVKLFEENAKEDRELRRKYAKYLIIILAIELVFLNIIFILFGCGVLKYSEIVFDLFITGGIAEIFVLIKTIIKHLFKDNLTDALNTILETNNKKPNYYTKNKKKKTDKP